MNKTKAQSSLVATQRAGQALDADFCRWHARLIDAELVASCTLENCPLQHAQAVYGCVKNPAHIVLRPGVTLADLKQAFGELDWSLFKDNLPELRSALNQLAMPKHSARALPEKGAVSHHGLLPHEREPVGPLVGLSKFLIDILGPSLACIGLSELETKEGLNRILSDVAPGSLEQGRLLCEFVHSHFHGLRFFIEQKPIIPDQEPFTIWLSTTHGNGLRLLDISLAHLNHLAQLVRYEPLHLDLPQRRLQKKRLLERNVFPATDWLQEVLGVSDSYAVDLMLNPVLGSLSLLGLTQEEERLEQIYSLLYDMPSEEPIEALLKMQRLLLSLITLRLGDPAFFLSEGSDRDQLMVRYHQALNRRDKALTNWYACRDGAAAGHHRALNARA